MSQSNDATSLGPSVVFRGELIGSGPVVIEGVVEGVVRVPGESLTIGKSAHVRGSILAQDVVVHGTLDGEVFAAGSIDLRDGAVFRGDLFVARLLIEDFAEVQANVDPGKANGEPGPYVPGAKLPSGRERTA